MRLLVLMSFATLACVTCDNATYTDAFVAGFEAVFALSSGASRIGYNTECLHRVHALMLRGGLPTSGEEMRLLNDTELMQMAIQAAVAAISPWKRQEGGRRILMEDDGTLNPQYKVGTMQSTIMTCVICTLLAVIGAMHIMSIRSVSLTTGPS